MCRGGRWGANLLGDLGNQIEASLVACMDQTHQLLAADLSIGQDMHGVCVLWVGYHRLGGKDRP